MVIKSKNILLAILFLISALRAGDFEPGAEALDWGGIALLSAGAVTLDYSGPFFEEPLFAGDTDLPHSPEETVPNSALYAAGVAIAGAVVALPLPDVDSDSRLCRRYRYLKGFMGMVALERFLVGLGKDLAGVPRPDADARRELGMPEREIRSSFPSGHASFAAAGATYFSLYLLDSAPEGEKTIWRAARGFGAAATILGAVYVADSRIQDNAHRPEDVYAGAGLGCASAAAAFLWVKHDIGTESGIVLEPLPGGLALSFPFRRIAKSRPRGEF